MLLFRSGLKCLNLYRRNFFEKFIFSTYVSIFIFPQLHASFLWIYVIGMKIDKKPSLHLFHFAEFPTPSPHYIFIYLYHPENWQLTIKSSLKIISPTQANPPQRVLRVNWVKLRIVYEYHNIRVLQLRSKNRFTSIYFFIDFN